MRYFEPGKMYYCQIGNEEWYILVLSLSKNKALKDWYALEFIDQNGLTRKINTFVDLDKTDWVEFDQ